MTYDEIIKKYKQHLTNAQVKQLTELSERYKALYAQQRAQATDEMRSSMASTRRGLQNMGLAGRAGVYRSGMEKAADAALTRSYSDYNTNLRRAEQAQLEGAGVRMANETIKRRNAAAEAEYKRKLAEYERLLAEQKRQQQEYNDNFTDPRLTTNMTAPEKAALANAIKHPKYDPDQMTDPRMGNMTAPQKAQLAKSMKQYTVTGETDPRLNNMTAPDKAALAQSIKLTKAYKEAEISIMKNAAKWDAAIAAAPASVSPRDSVGKMKQQEAEKARREKAEAESKKERALLASQYPAYADYLLMDDSQFSVGYDAAKRNVEKLEAEASRYKVAGGTAKAVPSFLQNKLNSAWKTLTMYEQAEKKRNETSADAYKYGAYKADTSNVPAAPAWAKPTEWTGAQNHKTAYNNGWKASDYEKRTGETSKTAALVNEWSYINGRTADRYMGSNAASNFFRKIAEGAKEVFGGDVSDSTAYKDFLDKCTVEYYGKYNGKDGYSAANKEKMAAMLTLANLMTDEERARYNTILKQSGAAEADNYFDYLYNYVLPDRFNDYVQKQYDMEVGNRPIYDENGNRIGTEAMNTDSAILSKIGASIASVPMNIGEGITAPASTIGTAQKDAVAARMGAMQGNRAQGLRNAVQEGFGKWGQFAYGTGMSMADSATVALISAGIGNALQGIGVAAEVAGKAGSVLGGSILGGSAFNSAYDEALQRGLSPEKARWTAAGQGVNEMLFEAISLDMLVDRFKTGDIVKASEKAWKNWVVNTLLQAGVEGSEEVFTDLANKMWDDKLNGIYSEELTKIREYMANGDSYEAAKTKVQREFAGELGMSFLGGAASGGVMGGGAGAMHNIQMGDYERIGNNMDNATKAELDTFKFTDEQAQEIQKQSKKTNQDYGVLAVTRAMESMHTDPMNAYKAVQSILDTQTRTEIKVDKRNHTLKTGTENSVSFNYDGVTDVKQMSGVQVEALRFAQTLVKSKVGGVNINVANQLYDKNGNEQNGWYDPKTNTVHVSLNGSQSVVYTISHELTHGLKEGNAEAFNSLRDTMKSELESLDLTGSDLPEDYSDILGDYLVKDGVQRTAWEALVNYEQDRYAKHGIDLDRASAEEEVVCRACETMLEKSRLISSMVSRNVRSARKIAKLLASISDDIEALKAEAESRGYEDGSPEQMFIDQYANIEKIANAWASAMKTVSQDETKKIVKEEGRGGKARQLKQHGQKLSIKESDAQYMDLARRYESGDKSVEAELRKQVDAAAKAAGYSIKAFHGTTENFNVFSRKQQGANHKGYLEFGAGFYFTPSETEAEQWVKRGRSGQDGKAPNVMSVYLNPMRMLSADESVPGGAKYLRTWLSQGEAEFIAARTYRFINYLIEDKGFSNVEAQETLKALGYDAIEATFKNGTEGQYVVFDPSQIKSADLITKDNNGNIIPLSKRFKTENEDIRYSVKDNVKLSDSEYMNLAEKYKDGTATDADKAVLQKEVEAAAKKNGYTIKGIHGTTKLFWIFDRAYGNAEGDWGKGFYFTTNIDDAKTNYAASTGADLETKIERLAEQLEWQDGFEEASYEERVEKAREILDGGENRTIDAYLKAKNPVVIGGKNQTYFDYTDGYNYETEEYDGDEGGLFLDFINAVRDELEENYEWERADKYDFTDLIEKAYDGGVSAQELEKDAKLVLAEVDDGNGNMAGNEVIRAAFERIGFDSIIDNTVSEKWGSRSKRFKKMEGVNDDTQHIIVFESSQAKMSDPVTYDKDGNIIPLSERFNENKEDIRYSMMDKEFRMTKQGAVRTFEQNGTTATVIGSSVELDGGSLLNRVRMMQNIAEVYGSVTVDATSEKEAEAFKRAGAQREVDTFGDSEYGTWVFEHQDNKYEKDTQFDAKQKRNFADAVLKEIGTRKNFTKDQLLRFRAGLEKAFSALHNATFGDGDAMVAYEYADKLFDRMLDAYTEMPEDASMLRDTILDAMRRTTDGKGRIVRELDVTKTQMSEIRNAFENVADFNRALSKALGTRVFAKEVENATMLENLFTHTDDSRFDATTNEGDMPSELLKLAQQTVVDRVNKYKAESDERMAMKEAMWDKATEIVGAEKTAAQKVREAVKQVRAEERAKAKTKAEKNKLAEQMERGEFRAKVRREERARYDRKLDKLKEVKYSKDERVKKDLLTVAKTNYQRLVNMLANPTEASHVPVQLARQVSEICLALSDLMDADMGKKADSLYDAVKSKRGVINMDKLIDAYKQTFADKETIEQATRENPNYDPRGSFLDMSMYDETLVQMMEGVGELLKGKTVKQMDAYELRALMYTLRGVLNTVYDANKATIKGEKRFIYKVAEKMVSELQKSKNVFGKKQNAITRFLNQYTIESLGLRRIAKLYSNSDENAEFVKLVDDLNEGAIEVERIALALRKMFDPVTKKYAKDMKTWYGKNAEWIDIGNGVKITKGMRVSLAMHLLNEQNLRNLTERGVTIPNQAEYKRGDYEQAYTDGTIVKMTKEQAQKIVSEMTEAEKAYFEVAKEFFHKRAGYYINRTSLKMLGYAKAIVENYFPIQVDDAYKMIQYDAKSLAKNASVEHPGFLETRKGTANVMYLNDITAVVNRQINGVSKYAGLAIPMRNWNAVMNQWMWHEDANKNWVADKGNVHAELKKQMGVAQFGKSEQGRRAMVSFVDQFVEDLAGASINNANEYVSAATIGQKLTSNYVKAVLTLNARVALSQLASVPTAAAEIPWKYIAQSFAGNVEQHLNRNASNELIDMYTPIFAMRRAGTQTEVSEVMKRKGLSEKAEQKLPWALGWITAMDTAATRRLWYACERWVKGETSIPVGSDAFYQEVAKRYERVIQNTQPNFTVLQRSPALRSKNAAARIITMFGTQRMQNAGVFIESAAEVIQAKDKATRKAALKRFGRTLSGMITAAIVIGLERAIVSALRGRMRPLQDDDKEITAKSIDKYIRNEIGTSLAGSFMYVGEIYDFVHGFISGLTEGDSGYEQSFALPAAEALSTLIGFFRDKDWQYFNYMQGDHTDHEKWLKTKSFINELMTVASYATGLPLANASKTILNGLHPFGHDIADAIKTGEFIPYLHQSGRIDKKKTNANYTEWVNLGKKGSTYLYWDDKMNGIDGGREPRISELLKADDLTNEEKAMLTRMFDTAGAKSKGTKVFNKKDELIIDFAHPEDWKPKTAATIDIPKQVLSTNGADKLTDAKLEGVTEATEHGVPAQEATDAFVVYQNIGQVEGRDDEFREWLFRNVDDPHQRAVLDYQVIGRAAKVEGAITYRDSGTVYRDYTNEAWYKLSQHSLAKDGTNKRYDAGKRLEKTGLPVEKTVAIYDGLKDLTKKAEWTEYLKKQGLTDEQVNIFLWSRGWAKID